MITFSACSNDNENVNNVPFQGRWNYSQPHIVFEYSEANIQLPGMPMAIPSASIASLLSKLAHEKMQAYFKGVDFVTADKLIVSMVKGGVDADMPLNYTVKGDHISLDIAQLVPEGMPLKKLDLKYINENNQITLYLENALLQTMLQQEAMQRVIASQIPGSMTPEQKLNIVKEIVSKIKKLEIGFIIKR